MLFVARPKKSEERDTRQGILDAALDLFAENGFFGTSMREIAKAVGVRESALYHHFPSKEAILEGLMESLGPGLAKQLGELDIGAMVDAVGPRRFLSQLVDFMVTQWSTPREQKMMRLMMSEGPRLSARDVLHMPSYIRTARTHLSRVFDELMRMKHIRKGDPYACTLEFMGPLMVLRMVYLIMPKGPPDLKGLKTEVDRHLDFFWQSVT
jgi:AcrR family transcriptional regulator